MVHQVVGVRRREGKWELVTKAWPRPLSGVVVPVGTVLVRTGVMPAWRWLGLPPRLWVRAFVVDECGGLVPLHEMTGWLRSRWRAVLLPFVEEYLDR